MPCEVRVGIRRLPGKGGDRGSGDKSSNKVTNMATNPPVEGKSENWEPSHGGNGAGSES